MSQTIGLTRLSYSRVWHHISASTPHPTLTTAKGISRSTGGASPAAISETTTAAAATSTSIPTATSAITPSITTTPEASISTATPPSLGRLASRIAVLLMGKHKPTWDPSTDCGDYVVVSDCAALYVTGRKKWQKTYYRHSTRPGSLKSVTMDVLMAKYGGSEILRRAVNGMLPKNRLRQKRLARLKAFEGEPPKPFRDNVVRFGGVKVGEEGWEDVVQAVRRDGMKRL